MPADDNTQRVRFRDLDWSQLCRDRWGKDWNKPEPAYEFSGGRTFDDPKNGGPYAPQED